MSYSLGLLAEFFVRCIPSLTTVHLLLQYGARVGIANRSGQVLGIGIGLGLGMGIGIGLGIRDKG